MLGFLTTGQIVQIIETFEHNNFFQTVHWARKNKELTQLCYGTIDHDQEV